VAEPKNQQVVSCGNAVSDLVFCVETGVNGNRRLGVFRRMADKLGGMSRY
jgi:hypothetical protein